MFYIRSNLTKLKYQFRARKKQILIAVIIVFVFVVVSIAIHVANVLILKKSVKKILDNFKYYGEVHYAIDSNIVTGKIFAKNIEIISQNGSYKCDMIMVKKTSGIIVPSEVELKIYDIQTTMLNNEKIYTLSQQGDNNSFYIGLKGGLFKQPEFNKFLLSSPVNLSILDEDKEVGNIKINDLAVAIMDGRKEMKYRGSMMFNSKDFEPYVFSLNVPFKWDLHIYEMTKQEQSFLDTSKTTNVNIVNIDKFFMDFGETEISAKGKISYLYKPKNINLEINIKNDKALLDHFFNILTKQNTLSQQQMRLTRFMIKKMIRLLKKNDEKSTKHDLHLTVQKTDIMPDYVVNDISFADLRNKIIKLIFV